eukprot:14070311-Alexandrium_andersonii.AAC.1
MLLSLAKRRRLCKQPDGDARVALQAVARPLKLPASALPFAAVPVEHEKPWAALARQVPGFDSIGELRLLTVCSGSEAPVLALREMGKVVSSV